jgi:tyrosine-protein phosphatase YwqE
LQRIKAKGFFPVLAHPERYTYMGKSEYQELKNLGVKFQLNLLSLVGAYGTHAQKKAEELLKGSMYNMSGSDVHRLSQCNLFNENHAFSHDVVKRLNLSAS